MKTKPLVGISSCLLGEKVRYDGGHKLDSYLTNVLGKYVDFLPLCPEFECGMSIPREPMRLEFSNRRIRLITLNTKKDLTSKINTWIKSKISEIESKFVCGFIFKSKSPSCGFSTVQVFASDDSVVELSSGLFAKAIADKYPHMPIEDEVSLTNTAIMNGFMQKVSATYNLYHKS